jgi:hypothetical protein
MPAVFFITHPDVLIDPNAPVPEWPLNERGRARMRVISALLVTQPAAAPRHSATEMSLWVLRTAYLELPTGRSGGK